MRIHLVLPTTQHVKTPMEATVVVVLQAMKEMELQLVMVIKSSFYLIIAENQLGVTFFATVGF